MHPVTHIEPTASERVYLLSAYAACDPRTVRRYIRDRTAVRPSIRDRLDRAARRIEITPTERHTA